MADVAHQGRSSVINEDRLGNDRTSIALGWQGFHASNNEQLAGSITRVISFILST